MVSFSTLTTAATALSSFVSSAFGQKSLNADASLNAADNVQFVMRGGQSVTSPSLQSGKSSFRMSKGDKATVQFSIPDSASPNGVTVINCDLSLDSDPKDVYTTLFVKDGTSELGQIINNPSGSGCSTPTFQLHCDDRKGICGPPSPAHIEL